MKESHFSNTFGGRKSTLQAGILGSLAMLAPTPAMAAFVKEAEKAAEKVAEEVPEVPPTGIIKNPNPIKYKEWVFDDWTKQVGGKAFRFANENLPNDISKGKVTGIPIIQLDTYKFEEKDILYGAGLTIFSLWFFGTFLLKIGDYLARTSDYSDSEKNYNWSNKQDKYKGNGVWNVMGANRNRGDWEVSPLGFFNKFQLSGKHPIPKL